MTSAQQGDPSHISAIIERNIHALLEKRKATASARKVESRVANAITKFAGSMASVYVHLFVFGAWIAWNVGWLHLKPFDPSFIILATEAGVEAIFLSTFILISQNEMSEEQDKRAELDLQISLLTNTR